MRGVLLGIALLCSTSAVGSNEQRVARCDRCDEQQLQKAALRSVSASGVPTDVYVTDNARRTIDKYRVSVAHAPGAATARAVRVAVEPAVGAFVADYWRTAARLAATPIDVPPAIGPSLPDYLGNPAVRGDVGLHVRSQIESLLRFPASSMPLVWQMLSSATPTLGLGHLAATLAFADGGQLQLQLTPGVDISTATIGIAEIRELPGSARLDGASIPTEPADFGGYDRSAPPAKLAGELARLASMWGIKVSCVDGTRQRFACDAHGRSCIREAAGGCPSAP